MEDWENLLDESLLAIQKIEGHIFDDYIPNAKRYIQLLELTIEDKTLLPDLLEMKSSIQWESVCDLFTDIIWCLDAFTPSDWSARFAPLMGNVRFMEDKLNIREEYKKYILNTITTLINKR